MSEYIRRMSAMTICERYRQHCFESNDNRGQDIADRIFDEIVEIPTVDVVKVVRCKDCKHCKLQYPAKAKGEEAIEGYYCYLNREYVKPTHYCSYGELKEREGK